MPNFRYRALTQTGEVVSGSIAAPTAAEVARRIEYLGLVPIETVTEQGDAPAARVNASFFYRPRSEDVTVFTRDFALLLKAGARIDDALALLASDMDIGRLRPFVGQIRASVVAGESLAEAMSHHPLLFPDMFVALVRVGEASGTLDHVLEALGSERARSEALQRKVGDALRYPAFVLFAAGTVLVFFLLFVLPQFASVLRDFGAKLDPIVMTFLSFSELLRAHTVEVGVGAVVAVIAGWLVFRRPKVRSAMMSAVSRVPLVRTVFSLHRTALFCRNLGVLLGSGVPLTTTLRILVDMMARTGNAEGWSKTAERVRHGGKLSDGLAEAAILPAMAVRMIKIGEETGQLPVLSGRVADFYEAKLQRSLDRVVGIVGPLAIIIIAAVVGGLIVSVMTALMSVTQIVG
ncbi:MAG: ral secretion pathway protein [Alphaproteobacteria bacterium]|nr:ral secretion pathway protein [Alphaproteobacteria bacterium]